MHQFLQTRNIPSTIMKYAFIILFILFFAFGCRTPQNGTTKEAEEYANTAMKLMQEKRYAEAVKWLKKAVQANPDLITYKYELAYAYYARKDYKTAIKILNKIVDDVKADERYYWLLGTVYDASGDDKKAKKTYRRGLERFPDSGELYLDAGGLEYRSGNNDGAVEFWEQGIERNPTYASNYYWAAQLYCRSNEKIWGLLYGELFILMDPNSKRSEEMSRLLYQTYEAAFVVPDGTEIASEVTFSEQAKLILVLEAAKSDSLPFEAMYEQTAKAVFTALEMDAPHGLTPNLETICKFRYYFVLKWFGDLLNKRFPNALLERHDQLLENELLDAYSHWLLRNGAPAAFEAWLKKGNVENMDGFVAWNNANPMKVGVEKSLFRGQYLRGGN